jgi:hypothetical protein
MSRFSALLWFPVATAFFLVANAERHPEWLRDLGVDWCGLADLRDAVQGQEAIKQQLEAQLARVPSRMQQREQIGRDLVTGRLDFFSAAARFHQLDALSPCVERQVSSMYPTASPGERACRHLLAWLSKDVSRTPGAADRRHLVHRLSAELEYHLRIHGTVKLPPEPHGGGSPPRT